MKFSSEAITEACTKIVAHRKVGPLWHTKFCTQQAAAESWLDYKAQHTGADLEQ